MQYWINHNGVQSGPVELDELKKLGLTSSAYVWHEGMSDWVKITQLPELQGYYDLPAEPAEPLQADDVKEEPATVEAEAEAEAPAAAPPPIPVQTNTELAEGQTYQQQPVVPEPCPPTNMVWAIVSTLLCCLPAGIVAIVYALKVTKKYRAGDIEGAKRASETGAWWCIASIVLGILTYPFVYCMQMSALS